MLVFLPDFYFVANRGVADVFIAGERTESIKTWDLRQNKVLYELSTGNNRPADIVLIVKEIASILPVNA